jgi:hypothetical protein
MPEMEDVKPARKMKLGVENLESPVERSEELFFICMKHSHLTGMGTPVLQHGSCLTLVGCSTRLSEFVDHNFGTPSAKMKRTEKR